MSIDEIDSDGYNVTASDNSDTDSERVAGYEAKYGQKSSLLSHQRQHNMNRIEYKEGRHVSVPCTSIIFDPLSSPYNHASSSPAPGIKCSILLIQMSSKSPGFIKC